MNTTAHYQAKRGAAAGPQKERAPYSDPGRRPSRIVVAVALVAVFALAVIALVASILVAVLLTGDGSSDVNSTGITETTVASTESTSSTAEPTTAAPAPTAAPTETSVAPSSAAPSSTVPTAPRTSTLGSHPLTLRGMGPVMFGMGVPEAEEALGADFEFTFGTPSECDYATISGDPDSPLLMVLTDDGYVDGGFIARIDLIEEQTTLSGIGIGSTKADVLDAYGDRIVATPHPYGGQAGSEYLTYVPADEADANYRVIFETLDDVVYGVRAGTMPWVEWMEGCA